MKQGSPRRMLASLSFVLPFALFGLLAFAPSASATFPGANGRIAYAGEGVNGTFDIFSINPNGSDIRQLTTNPATDTFPVWSPDGRRIAFESNRDGNLEIYVMNADGSGQTNISNNAVGDDYHPAWSPDGTRIAFISGAGGEIFGELWVMNANGTNLRRLTDNNAVESRPDWSPDGQAIAFETNRDGNYEIYTTNLTGTVQTRITNNAAFDGAPSWSPDGQRIAFKSNRDGDFEVYVMNRDGSGVTKLTSNSGPTQADELGPVWSPDGAQIAFVSTRNGNTDVYVMNADGSGLRRLTTHPDIDSVPDWQPIPTGTGPGQGGFKNRAHFCKAERSALGRDLFRQTYGGNGNGIGKCVSGSKRQNGSKGKGGKGHGKGHKK